MSAYTHSMMLVTCRLPAASAEREDVNILQIYYQLLHLAIVGAGGIFTGSNPGYTSYELKHHIKTSHAKYIIGEPSLLHTILQAAKDVNVPTTRILAFDAVDKAPYEGVRSWETLLQHGEEDWIRFDDDHTQRTTVANLGFTSGSTGLPKAAMISHSYMVYQLWALQSKGKPYEVRKLHLGLQGSCADVVKVKRLLCVPAFHAYGLPLNTGTPLRERHPAYLMRRFDKALFAELTQRYQITETAMVPAMIAELIKLPAETKEGFQSTKGLDSLRYIWSAGSPLQHTMQTDFKSRLHDDANIAQVWGMTEVAWGSTQFWPDGNDDGSVGRPLPGFTFKLVDEEGVTIHADNQEGELYVKGPSMMLGYLDNPTATASAIDSQGWLKSGDMALRKGDKYYVVDRKKDLIKVRGWQVAPAEVEGVLIKHPRVLSAAVVGVPNTADTEKQTSELPRAFIVRKPVEGVSELDDDDLALDIKSFVAKELSRYKHLDGGVVFVDEIPRNAMGKTIKGKLIASHQQHGAPAA